MRRKDLTVENINPANTDYPFGRIRDNQGAGDGTPIIEALYGDIIEFFTALVINAGVITPNNLPDNATNGYQTLDALKQFASKHNYISDMVFNGANLLDINQHISNMDVNEFLVVTFKVTEIIPTPGQVTLPPTTQIRDLGNNFYNCIFSGDDNNVFYDGSNYIVKKESTGNLAVYSIPTTASLQSIYNRIGETEEVASEALRVVAKGRYSSTAVPSEDGVITVDHPVVSVAETRIIYTISRGNPGSSLVATDFKNLLLDRSNNLFRIVYSGFPHNSGMDYPVVDWWIVRA